MTDMVYVVVKVWEDDSVPVAVFYRQSRAIEFIKQAVSPVDLGIVAMPMSDDPLVEYEQE